MVVGLVAALLAATAYGVAAVLQGVAARSATGSEGALDARVLLRLLRHWRYATGLVLDGLGFLAQLVALRSLPLFLVQAALAASLAVTAVVAVRVARVVLGRREWLAVAAVCAGLAALGSSAAAEGGVRAGGWFDAGLLAAAVLLAACGPAGGRLSDRARVPVLGLVAGLSFGVVATSARVLPGWPALLAGPAAYAVPVAGIAGTVCYAAALQRGGVTVATAALVVGETAPPAVVGVLALGDHTRPGLAWLAVTGFLAAVLGALALARFGEVGVATPDAPEAPAGVAGPQG